MTDMQQLAERLRQSINQYSRIMTLLLQIDRRIGTAPPEDLQEMDRSLAELQSQATEIDQFIPDQLTKESENSETIRSLLDERATIVKDIIRLNGDVTTKAMGVKSILAHEIGTLRSGLSALKGYRKQQHNQGRILNSTS